MTEPVRMSAAAWWGVLGFIALLVQASYRLAQLALEPLAAGVAGWVIALYAVSITFNAYAEGYKGFHLAAAPRLVARAIWLSRNPSPARVVLAPLFCMGLFHATKKRLIVSYCLYIGIIILVILVRQLSQPYRGIVDAGVVVGLGLGTLSVIYYFVRALRGLTPSVSPDIPEQQDADQKQPAAA